MNSKYFLYLFYFISLAELAAGYNGWQIRMFTKPMIMICLITYYLVATKSIHFTHGLLIVAMLAALAGDVLLMIPGMFIAGLGAFLVMQVLYIACFRRDRCFVGRREWIYALILVAIVGLVISQMWASLGAMKVWVLLYTIAIALMSWVSYTRDYRLPGYWWVFAGTVFFLISDSALALEKFAGYPVGSLTVMGTYILAQFMIVKGMVMKSLPD